MPNRDPARGRVLADARRANRTLVKSRRRVDPEPTLSFWGKVSAFTSTTLSLDMGGSSPITGVPYAATYSPTNGDLVRVEERNNLWFVTGKRA